MPGDHLLTPFQFNYINRRTTTIQKTAQMFQHIFYHSKYAVLLSRLEIRDLFLFAVFEKKVYLACSQLQPERYAIEKHLLEVS